MITITAITVAVAAIDLPTVIVDRDNVRITQSCIVRVAAEPLIDADGNGVIHIQGNNLTVRFENSPRMDGAHPDQQPDSFSGTGIAISGRNITLSGASVRGYKVGIHAVNADGLTIHDCDVSDNFAQRLKSTPSAEDSSDWLWPHSNDDNQWITSYGAGLCIEQSDAITLRDIRARNTQNGIILNRVNDSKVYDCDCSFLSGWGLAMWRSSRNVISRNAFDFCVRGYSHDVYNRGQDSAGILAFEQCSDNVFIENSATHGGDGFFGFAGKEALGEVNTRDAAWYVRRGNNDNIFVGNDFSYAPAHGLELTFSFGNRILNNRFVGNAICGIWGGYSSESVIAHNHFEANGAMAYGLERGGINIEHGQRNLITHNVFLNNMCGIHLWWDNDAGLLQTPWALANGGESNDNRLLLNAFTDNVTGVHLRDTTNTTIAGLPAEDSHPPMLDADAISMASLTRADTTIETTTDDVRLDDKYAQHAIGNRRPVGSRTQLAGRENIIMTEWGPWDHVSPLIQFAGHVDGADEYRLLGKHGPIDGDFISLVGEAVIELNDRTARVRAVNENTLTPYRLTWTDADDGTPLSTARGVLLTGAWTVATFASLCDPREDVERWRAGATDVHAYTFETARLDFAFGGGGMTQLRKLEVDLPRDHFGVIATRMLKVSSGRYRINSTSDDGIRVWLDDELVIDDWTWHAPKRHHFDFVVDQPRALKLRVEYFELDGHAVLAVDVEPRS